ncbi:Molybdenum cofactor guanylyltransferase [Falsiruegeria litorea R37]|uniref:Molybdenum cofactor guanylyltransferase n=1 Tax=Falsiruegeria litorea R37 TaxID=1200284 RepID=A0A1Y5TJQ7_9RHOB|nr:molybdenum cofactor guanylyltransferase MobA [Falsiruegeria litorea]SLN65724.1 Molybdenum cofactor guanylyltransferase [Falsiruegeria litorea R37]
MTKPLGVILAGGQARRMGGGDKGALILGGRSLLDRVIDRLGPQVDRLVLNANGDPQRFAEYGLPVVPDSLADYPGPLAGVLAGMEYAADQGFSHIVTAAADTPFFPQDLTERLARAADRANTPIALAATQEEGRMNRHPTFGLWPVNLRADLRAALEDGLRKVVLWTDKHGAASAPFDDNAFFNINTPEDLAQAETML